MTWFVATGLRNGSGNAVAEMQQNGNVDSENRCKNNIALRLWTSLHACVHDIFFSVFSAVDHGGSVFDELPLVIHSFIHNLLFFRARSIILFKTTIHSNNCVRS